MGLLWFQVNPAKCFQLVFCDCFCTVRLHILNFSYGFVGKKRDVEEFCGAEIRRGRDFLGQEGDVVELFGADRSHGPVLEPENRTCGWSRMTPSN